MHSSWWMSVEDDLRPWCSLRLCQPMEEVENLTFRPQTPKARGLGHPIVKVPFGSHGLDPTGSSSSPNARGGHVTQAKTCARQSRKLFPGNDFLRWLVVHGRVGVIGEPFLAVCSLLTPVFCLSRPCARDFSLRVSP